MGLSDFLKEHLFRPEGTAAQEGRAVAGSIATGQNLEADADSKAITGDATGVKIDYEKLEGVIRTRHSKLTDIYKQLDLLVNRQVSMLYLISIDLKRIPVTEKNKDAHEKVSASIHAAYDKLKEVLDAVLKDETSMESGSFSMLKALDAASLAAKEYYELKRIKATARKVRKDQKREDRAVASANPELMDRQIKRFEEDFGREIKDLLEAIDDNMVQMQKDVRDLDRLIGKMKKLLEEGYPKSSGEELETKLKKLRDQMHTDLTQAIEDHRKKMSDVEHQALAA
jgi:hypothetical protein